VINSCSLDSGTTLSTTHKNTAVPIYYYINCAIGYYLRQGTYVVCLLATSRKNDRSDLRENFSRDVSVDKKELMKY